MTLHEPDWSIDPEELRAAFGPRTRGIVINSPHNPTGKVFRPDELELIAGLCVEFDALAFTDDIYEHIVFEGEHIPLATLPGMAERTVSIHSMSKSYSVTGWRIGWTIASPELSLGIRRVHDFLTVGAAAPLQAAAVVALGFPDAYYEELVAALSREHAGDAVVVPGPPRIALHPLLEMPRLADIEHLARPIDHAVDAGTRRRRLGVARNDRRARLGTEQGVFHARGERGPGAIGIL